MSYSLSNSRTYITSDNDNHKTSVWYRRSRLEKVLLLIVLFLSLLSIGLLIGLIFEANKNKEIETPDHITPTSDTPTGEPICDTKECLIAAAKIQASMDLSANPCDDFYQYACGNWMKTNIIPPDRSRWGQFDITRQSLADNVRVLLDESNENDNYQNLSIISKTKSLYKACINLSERKSGIEHLRTLLASDIDWPFLNPSWDPSSFVWQEKYAKLNQKFGVSFILSNYVAQDAKNTSIYSIYIDAPTFGTGRSQLINPNTTNNIKILAAYKAFMKNSIELLKLDNSETLDEDIDKMIEFETQLALTISDNRTNRFELYGNKTTIEEFDINYPKIGLLDIETRIFNSFELNIDKNEGLIVYDKEYFLNLGEIIESFELRTIANYLGWRTVRLLGPYTDSTFRNYEFEYNKVVTGVEELKPIWEECVDVTNARLPFAVGRLYVDEHFSEDAKSNMLDMINQLEASFKELLETNDWMDEVTKNNTRQKLEYIERAIAYPDFLKNNDSLEDYYSGVPGINENFFFLAIEDLLMWSTQRLFKRLRNDASDRSSLDWSTGPAIVNAFYSPNINRITFPAGILQSPFYTYGLPTSLNLGGIGMVIGHEITHGFDNSGSQYDKQGNLYDWWDNNTRSEFQERVNCFINQYTNYFDPLADRHLNGTKTVGENIADNGGIRQAFRALENYNGIKYALPGSMQNFTSEQLFFLSFANIWCSNLRPGSMISAIENEAHSPGKYRVIGSVSNSVGFAKAFNCANNTNMNPPVEDKCIIW